MHAHRLFGKFRVEGWTFDYPARIVITGSDNADGVYSVERGDEAGFSLFVEGDDWSIGIEIDSSYFPPPGSPGSFRAAELFTDDGFSPTEGLVTVLQTVKPFHPPPGTMYPLIYQTRIALRLVYLNEALTPRPLGSHIELTYDPAVSTVEPGGRFA